MFKDTKEDKLKFVEFLRNEGMYNEFISAQLMEFGHEVYHKAVESKNEEIKQLESDLDIKNSGTHTLSLLVKVDELKAELKKFYDNRFEPDKLFIYAGKLKEIIT